MTLTRTFAFHVWLLPAMLLLLAPIHIALVVIQGQFGSWINYEPEPPDAAPPDEDDLASYEKVKREVLDPESRKVNVPTRTTWFYPYHVFKEGVVTLVFFVGVFLLSVFMPIPVEQPVDPSTITYAPTSMWFFLFIDQLFLIFPGSWLIPAGAVISVITVIFVLYLLPWIDRSPGLRPQDRPVSLAFMFVLVFSILVLALLAASRVFNYDYINRPG